MGRRVRSPPGVPESDLRAAISEAYGTLGWTSLPYQIDEYLRLNRGEIFRPLEADRPNAQARYGLYERIGGTRSRWLSSSRKDHWFHSGKRVGEEQAREVGSRVLGHVATFQRSARRLAARFDSEALQFKSALVPFAFIALIIGWGVFAMLYYAQLPGFYEPYVFGIPTYEWFVAFSALLAGALAGAVALFVVWRSRRVLAVRAQYMAERDGRLRSLIASEINPPGEVSSERR